MKSWSLKKLFSGLHDDIQKQLEICRLSFGHPGTKGDASEEVWLNLFKKYLPWRYQAEKAHIVDSKNVFSDQIDIVIFDRQYTPLIFEYKEQKIIPAEGVYAVFEAKQAVNASQISYAKNKIASVRQLYRTSLPIPFANGTYAAKHPIPIYGGLLSFESDWVPALGQPLLDALYTNNENERIDIGCVAAHGFFIFDQKKYCYEVDIGGGKSATAFLYKLISMLQHSATVPMIDIEAYTKWLS